MHGPYQKHIELPCHNIVYADMEFGLQMETVQILTVLFFFIRNRSDYYSHRSEKDTHFRCTSECLTGIHAVVGVFQLVVIQ